MTTTVVYSDVTDGMLTSSNATYSTARAGGTMSINTTGNQHRTGQAQVFQYPLYEMFLQFNTSAIGSDTVSAAVLVLVAYEDQSATDFTLEARLYDWGTDLTTADWVPGASLAGLTLLASISTSGGWAFQTTKTFTDVAFPANINGAGQTRVVLASSRLRAGNQPGGAEYVASFAGDATPGTTYDPKLTITHAASGFKRSQAVVMV